MSEAQKLAFEIVCNNNNLDSHRRIEILKECIEAGIDINSNGTRILVNAIHNKDHETIDFLFENGIDGNWNLLLSTAISNDNLGIIKRLLDLGANPNLTTLITTNIDIIKLFMEYGYDPFINSNKLFVQLCIDDGYLPVIEYLMSIGANCLEPNNAPMIHACQSDSSQKIKRLLLGKGADPNATTNTYIDGDICLLELAIIYADLDGCKILLEYGADVNRCYNIINKQYDHAKDIVYDKKTKLKIKPIIDLFMEYRLDVTEFMHRMDIMV